MAADRKPTRVAEALAEYLADSGLGDRLEQVGVLDDWAERVGQRIAAVAEPRFVGEGGVLVVGVRSSPWLMELRMMEQEIRQRLNEGRTQGRIQQIRFVMEDEPAAGPKPKGWRRRG